MAGLLTSTPAEAHYPHDMAFWVAVSPDPEQPRLATSLEQIDLEILGRSEDGLDWAARLVQARDDGSVLSGAFLTPARLALGTSNHGLLVSEDAGDTLEPAPGVTDNEIVQVVASPNILVDGLAFAAGRTTLWRTDDAGVEWSASWTPATTRDGGGFTDVDVSPDFATDQRVCASDTESLSCSADGGVSWSRTTVPAGTSGVSVGTGHRVWAIVRGEGLYKSDDDGASWELVGFEGEDLAVIAELSGGLVLLAKSDTAEWRSTDGGESWSAVDVLHVVPDQSRDGLNFFDIVEGPDGAVYLSTWTGLVRSDDRGLTYSFYNTEPIENTHSVALTEGLHGAVSAWVGTYGGGPLLTDIQTLATETFPSLTKRFTRSTPVTTSWNHDGTAIFDEGYCTLRTTDYGETWDRIAQDPATAGLIDMSQDVKGVALSPDTNADPFVLTSNGEGTMAFLVSEDLGDTWTMGTQDPPCANNGVAVGLSPRWPEESRAWAACGGVTYESTDRGKSWSALGDTGASSIFHFAERTDGALLVATSDGLWLLDGGSSTQIAFAGALVDSVAASTEAGDDTVFVLVPTEGWMRSDDGGSTWTELPAPTDDVPRMVALSPTFAEDGTVAVAGYGGAWASTDRGDSWFSIYTVEIFETYHEAWRTTGVWTETAWEGASSGEVMVTEEPGASKTLDFRGVGVAVEGPAKSGCGGGDDGVVAVSLDGAAPEEISLPSPSGTLWAAEDLDDTWHTIRLEAISGVVAVDDVRVTRIPVALLTPEGCGRAKKDAGALLLLPLALLRRRHRLGRRRLGALGSTRAQT